MRKLDLEMKEVSNDFASVYLSEVRAEEKIRLHSFLLWGAGFEVSKHFCNPENWIPVLGYLLRLEILKSQELFGFHLSCNTCTVNER